MSTCSDYEVKKWLKLVSGLGSSSMLMMLVAFGAHAKRIADDELGRLA